MKPHVSIIIPVFNKLELTRQCLNSIQANTPHDLIEVIVVDNASTDGTLDFLNKWKGPFYLRVVPNRKNQGYAKANNQGARIARGDYVLFLNNDTAPQKNWLTALLDIFLHCRTAGAVGAKLLYPDGTIQHAGVVTVKDEVLNLAIHPFHIGYKKPDSEKYGKILKVSAVTGACLMMPVHLYRDLGGMDESYWNGYEDMDLCFKILEAGFEIYFQPQSVVIHYESQSGPERWIRSKENQELLDRKWGGVITCSYVLKPQGHVELNTGVSIVIVTSNSAAAIAPCIEALSRTLRVNDEVIIVDNASDDGTAALVRSQIANMPRFKLISNPINPGYAAAANQGAKAGLNPYVAFLNPDTLVGDHWIEHLQYHLMPHKTAAAGPVSNYAAGLQNADLYLPKEFRELNDLDTLNQELRQRYRQQRQETKLLMGFCLMAKRNVYERIGGMDENLTHGNVDLDLSWRIRTSGYELGIAKDCMVLRKSRDSYASESETTAHRHVQDSTDYLFYKLTRHYGPNKVPSSHGLWGIDGFRPICRIGENHPLTSIIVLTYNQKEYTQQCLESVFTHTTAPFELIIIDNGSVDGTVDYALSLERSKTSCVRIKVISNAENLGFAKGCNQGLSIAGGEFLLLLNNDVVVTCGWLSRLLRAVEGRTRIQMVGPMTNYVSGPQLVENPGYDVATADGLEQYAAAHASQYSGEIDSNWRLAGFCMLMKRHVIEKIGGLDDRFRIGNFEDDDFCLRAYLAGFHAAIAKDCYVHHYGSQTFLGNQIDFDERLNSNWALFKQKWNIPAQTPYKTAYQIPLPKSGFDKGSHHIAIEPGFMSTMRHHARKQSDSLSGCDPKPSDGIHLISPQPMHPLGGIQMSILDQVLEAVRYNVAPQDKSAAIWILQRVIEADPRHGKVHNELGLLLYEQNELAKAQSHLHQAVRFCQNEATFYKDLGDFYHVVLKDSAKALEMYEKAVELKSHDGSFLLTAAHLATAEKLFEKAKAYYKRLLEIDPGNQDARICLAGIQDNVETDGCNGPAENLYLQVQKKIESGDREGAAAGLRDIIDKYPGHALAHNDFAVLSYESGDKDAALEHYRQALRLEPDNLLFLKNLADFYWWEQQNSTAAMECYIQILEADPSDVETILSCAKICMALRKYDDARDFINRCKEIDPFNDPARLLGNQLDEEQAGDRPQADRSALYRQARERAAQGDLEGAVDALTHLVREHRQEAEAFNDLGVLYYELGHKEKALSCYREAVQLAPDQTVYCKNLADFYLMEQGRAEEALRLYLSVLEKNPLDIDSLLAIGFVCIELNKTGDARVFFERAAEIDPMNATVMKALQRLSGKGDNESGLQGDTDVCTPSGKTAVG